ncbi:DUF1311 domain-containing protein [Ancylothrix sp. C2]|uniref:lysozyme inhibitor LprI family protein n=1 Tax=Ancylothrix sp. D3o TaxID=2953691 RepID=UPI0021BB5852|nr:lysozyme inhibitor LprI family protein [Ancylothrix sp. D3o]MCT7952582.1 DUF1311 domain-containing protein [Ancylothrix sp. D3o]
MKLIIMATLVILPVALYPNPVKAEQCDGSTAEMVACGQRLFNKADARLNAVWQSLPKNKQNTLRDAQLKWIEYKERKCKAEASAIAEGGTMKPLIELGCLIGETEKRTAELEAFL